MNHDSYTDAYIAGILGDARTIAMVGASATTQPAELLRHEVSAGQGLSRDPRQSRPRRQGDPGPARLCVASPRCRRPVDIVDIFRSSAAALEVTREAIRLKDKLGIKVVWMQLGVRNDEAAAEAEAAGLQVVMNRCPKIEYGRLSGEIGWAGVNAGAISSKRPLLSGRGVQNHVIAGKR